MIAPKVGEKYLGKWGYPQTADKASKEVKAGDYQVGYTVAPGLDGKARLAGGIEVLFGLLLISGALPQACTVRLFRMTALKSSPAAMPSSSTG